MEEYQDQDSTDELDSDESPVMKELRNQLRAAQAKNEKFQAQQAEWEVAAQTQRAEAAQEVMNTLGLPGLTEDVLQWVQGAVTQEGVIEALESRSIPLPEGVEKPSPEDSQTPSASSVGQQVADAAAGADVRSLEERLEKAESAAEVAQIMDEAELSRSHY